MKTAHTSAAKLFQEHYIGALATVDSDGAPRSTTLHFVSDGEYVYWLSKPQKVHSQNIARDARVALTLASSSVARGLQGVYLRGQADRLPQEDQPRIYQLLEERVGTAQMPPHMEAAAAYRLKIGTCDEQKSTTNCWYFYS